MQVETIFNKLAYRQAESNKCQEADVESRVGGMESSGVAGIGLLWAARRFLIFFLSRKAT